MNKYILLFIYGLILGFIFTNVHASTINPCEYINLTISNSDKLDVGNDENFERIKQQNNKDMIRACQEYQIKLLDTMKGDLNRDNY